MSSRIGNRIGHFRVVDLIGQGGMGEVYVGYDEKLDRRVALKTLLADPRPDPESKTRFRREARVLSQLAHPNICQIFDYIESEEGDVLVLELIRGESLTAAMKKGLSYKQKLAIAEQIAGVLVAAHGKGIVHRDLKPDNVMLTEGEQVKVLDFGISRLHGDEQTAVVATPGTDRPSSDSVTLPPEALTAAGTVMGTVRYMSPEQARGQATTTASDLYSFGLLLQELFTGAPAYPPGLDARALLKSAATGETLPVEGIDPDLAALIRRLKSLAPAGRPSAVDTAERLAWIRQKPLRRRRTALVAAAMAVLALFGVAMTVQTIRATRAERGARRDAETSRQISEFLVGLFKVSDPGEAKGNTVTARELLDKGAEKIDRELKDQPAVRARLMETMGTVYRKLGLYPKAKPLLETALAIREKALGPDHPDVGRSLIALADLCEDQGQFADAEKLFRRSLAIFEKAPGAGSLDLARSLHGLAGSLLSQGQYARAEPLYERCLRIREKALGPDSPVVAPTLDNLAVLYNDEGHFAQAETLYRRSLGISEKALGPDHPDVAIALNNLATLYTDENKYDRAEPLFQRSLAIREKAFGPNHPDVAESLDNLASVYANEGRFAQAESFYQRSLAIREHTLGPRHPDVAENLYNLACLKAQQGKRAEALSWLRRALSTGAVASWAGRIKTDQDLVSLHGDPEFERIAAAAARPPASTP